MSTQNTLGVSLPSSSSSTTTTNPMLSSTSTVNTSSNSTSTLTTATTSTSTIPIDTGVAATATATTTTTTTTARATATTATATAAVTGILTSAPSPKMLHNILQQKQYGHIANLLKNLQRSPEIVNQFVEINYLKYDLLLKEIVNILTLRQLAYHHHYHHHQQQQQQHHSHSHSHHQQQQQQQFSSKYPSNHNHNHHSNHNSNHNHTSTHHTTSSASTTTNNNNITTTNNDSSDDANWLTATLLLVLPFVSSASMQTTIATRYVVFDDNDVFCPNLVCALLYNRKYVNVEMKTYILCTLSQVIEMQHQLSKVIYVKDHYHVIYPCLQILQCRVSTPRIQKYAVNILYYELMCGVSARENLKGLSTLMIVLDRIPLLKSQLNNENLFKGSNEDTIEQQRLIVQLLRFLYASFQHEEIWDWNEYVPIPPPLPDILTNRHNNNTNINATNTTTINSSTIANTNGEFKESGIDNYNSIHNTRYMRLLLPPEEFIAKLREKCEYLIRSTCIVEVKTAASILLDFPLRYWSSTVGTHWSTDHNIAGEWNMTNGSHHHMSKDKRIGKERTNSTHFHSMGNVPYLPNWDKLFDEKLREERNKHKINSSNNLNNNNNNNNSVLIKTTEKEIVTSTTSNKMSENIKTSDNNKKTTGINIPNQSKKSKANTMKTTNNSNNNNNNNNNGGEKNLHNRSNGKSNRGRK